MLLTLTTTHNPATDLGYLLHKNPTKLHSFELSFGKAHVFYPEATSERCTAALLLDVDPVFFNDAVPVAGAVEAVEAFSPYVEARLAEGVPLHAMTRHLLGLFNGFPGARGWRRHLAVEAVKPGADTRVLRAALQHVDRPRGIRAAA